MAKWGNEYTEDTSLEDLKLAEREAIEAEAEEEQKADEEEAKRAEEEAKKEEEVKEDPDKKEEEVKEDPDKKEEDEDEKKEDEDEIIDLDAEEEENKEEEEEKKEEEEEKKEEEEEKKEEPKEEEKTEPEQFELTVGEETYDAERATESINKLNAIEKDEFLKNLIEHRNNGGDVLDYLRANDNREDEMSSEDLVRYAFDNDPANQGLGREELDLLWESEKEDKYPLVVDEENGITEKDVKIATARLNRDAAKAKQQIKAEKAKFKIAEPNAEVASKLAEQELKKAQDALAIEQAESLKQWHNEVDQHDTTKTIQDKGMVVLEVDGKKIGYKTPDAAELIEMTKDLNAFLRKTTDEKGHVKLDVFSKVMAFAQNPEKFTKDLVKYGRMLERKDGLKDAKKIDPKKKASEDAVEENDNKKGMSATMASLKGAKWGGL